MTNKDYYAALEAAGHVLHRDEDGNIDFFVMDYGYHNGPGCVNCHDSWCEHCEDSFENCIGATAYEEKSKEKRFEQYLKLKEEFE